MTTPVEPKKNDKHNPAVVGVGSQLRKAREACNLSRMDVAEQLYLEEKTIYALENDSYSELPEALFVKGYIRNYARLVGLDSEKLVKLYESSEIEQPPPALKNVCKTREKVSEDSSLPSWQIIFLGIVGVLLLLFVYLFNNSDLVEQNITTAVTQESIDPPLSAEIFQDGDDTDEERVADLSAEDTLGNTNENSDDSKGEPAADENAETVAKAVTDMESSGDIATITMSFIRDSWVEVSDANDKRLYFDLAKNGSEINLSGVAPFNVLLGYAIGVTIQYNGEPFDLTPYIRGKMARFTLGKAGDRMVDNEL